MAKAIIINVTVDNGINTAYVTYSTGTEKTYPADKLPKTVQSWIEEAEKERKRQAFHEKRTAVIEASERGEDVPVYSEFNGKEVELTEQELSWFHEMVDRCRAVTGCTVPIAAFNYDLYAKVDQEALGTTFTDHPDEPLKGDTHITIDTFFIHEMYLTAFEGYPSLTQTTLEEVIMHEIAHTYVWEHGEEHTALTEKFCQMLKAYDVAQNEQEIAQNEQEVAQNEQEVAQELDHETVQAVEDPELTVPLLEVSPEIPQRFPRNSPESRHNVSGRPRQLQRKETKSLSLDIVDAVVGALLMASRLSLIALAYMFAGMAAAVRAGISAYAWLAPRSAALIERSVSTYHDFVRPACHDAAVWMAEATWYVVICLI